MTCHLVTRDSRKAYEEEDTYPVGTTKDDLTTPGFHSLALIRSDTRILSFQIYFIFLFIFLFFISPCAHQV
jgi:hypothetical protein